MDKNRNKINDIIKIGTSFDAPKARIIRIYNEDEKKYGLCGDIQVVYNQNNWKIVRDDLVWTGTEWVFKTDGPGGFVVGSLDRYPELK